MQVDLDYDLAGLDYPAYSTQDGEGAGNSPSYPDQDQGIFYENFLIADAIQSPQEEPSSAERLSEPAVENLPEPAELDIIGQAGPSKEPEIR